MGQRPAIDAVGRELIIELAIRRDGVTVAEIAARLHVSYDATDRFMKGMVARGSLIQTEETRRREDVFYRATARGGVIYRANRRPRQSKWISLDMWRKRQKPKSP